MKYIDSDSINNYFYLKKSGNPDEQPTPKTYFNYHYVFDNYPDALNGFKYAPRDPFVV